MEIELYNFLLYVCIFIIAFYAINIVYFLWKSHECAEDDDATAQAIVVVTTGDNLPVNPPPLPNASTDGSFDISGPYSNKVLDSTNQYEYL